VRIKNPMSPYGITEQVMVSTYDIGRSPDAAFIDTDAFNAEDYLKRLANSTLKEQEDVDNVLQEKGMESLEGNPTYYVVLETDIGYDKKIQTVSYYIYVEKRRYVLILSFMMEVENYPIYKYILDAIIETLRFSITDVHVEPQSFMDIYLQRSRR